jgi:hypothetical protein
MRACAFVHSLLATVVLTALRSVMAAGALVVGVLVVAVLAVGAPATAHAQSDGDRATAMSLFQAGRALMKDGSFQEACPKFEAAQQLVPGVGTQFNLAECYVKIGRHASAWINYVEVARATKAAGQQSRSTAAQTKADELKARLSTLKVEVMQPVQGMAISINDKLIPEGQWGTPVAKDPGRYTVQASAAGYATQSYAAAVGSEGQAAVITITPMQKGGSSDGGSAGSDADPVDDSSGADSGSTFELEALGIAGIVIAGVGIVALIAGGAMFASGSADIDDADARCPNRDLCTDPAARELGNDGVNMQNASYGVLAVGSAALVGGVIMFVIDATNDSDDVGSLRVEPLIGENGAALSVTASF